MEPRDEVQALAGKGLDGDRYAIEAGKYSGTKVGKRAVTLIEREAIAGARDEYELELAEQETRRNLVTEGVPVNHLVGREFTVGGVRMRGYDLAEPCVYLEGLTRKPASARRSCIVAACAPRSSTTVRSGSATRCGPSGTTRSRGWLRHADRS